jgi:membrane-associated protease RseP (regulator of RpoE activity)
MRRLLIAVPRWGVSCARCALLAGWLGFCVVVSVGTLYAAPDQPPKEEPKKEEPKKPDRIDPFLPPQLDPFQPPGLDPAEARRIQERLRAVEEAMRKQLEEMRKIDPDLFKDFPQRFGPGLPFAVERRPHENRLGAMVQSPTSVLVDQLDLPKDQGIVIQEVKDGSAADKAGLKPNDILLELNGKAVPSKLDDFGKMLNEIKQDTAVDATVLRKGKKETIKGIKLPEVKAEEPQRLPPIPFPDIQIQPFPNVPRVPPLGAPAPGGQSKSVQITRTNDSFTTHSRSSNESISVAGKIKDGKAEPDDIVITMKGESKKYKTVDDVPAELRDGVKELIRMTEKGTASVTLPEKKP